MLQRVLAETRAVLQPAQKLDKLRVEILDEASNAARADLFDLFIHLLLGLRPILRCDGMVTAVRYQFLEAQPRVSLVRVETRQSDASEYRR
jgi:hypothetical protein